MRISTALTVLVAVVFTAPPPSLKLPQYPKLFNFTKLSNGFQDHSNGYRKSRHYKPTAGDCPDGWEDIGGENCYKFFHRAVRVKSFSFPKFVLQPYFRLLGNKLTMPVGMRWDLMVRLPTWPVSTPAPRRTS